MVVKPVVALDDDCQDHDSPGATVSPTLNIFDLKLEQPFAGPALAMPARGVPVHGGAPPKTYTA